MHNHQKRKKKKETLEITKKTQRANRDHTDGKRIGGENKDNGGNVGEYETRNRGRG